MEREFVISPEKAKQNQLDDAKDKAYQIYWALKENADKIIKPLEKEVNDALLRYQKAREAARQNRKES